MSHFFFHSNTLSKSCLPLDEDNPDMSPCKATLWELWITIGICCVQILLCIAPLWYYLEKVTYRYQVGDTWGPLETIVIESSYYGLLSAHLNKWTINHTWFSLKKGVCEQVSSLPFGDEKCGTNCLHHLQTRCDVYTKVYFLGMVTCVFLCIGCALILFALCRLNTRAKFKNSFQCIWVLGVGCLNVAILIQIFLVKNNLRKLSKTSLFPPVQFSFAFYLSCAVVLLLFIVKMLVILYQHNGKIFKKNADFRNQVGKMYEDNLKDKQRANISQDQKNTDTISNMTHYQPPIYKTIPRPPMHFIY